MTNLFDGLLQMMNRGSRLTKKFPIRRNIKIPKISGTTKSGYRLAFQCLSDIPDDVI